MAKKNGFNYFGAFDQLSALAVEEADLLIEVLDGFTTADDLKGVLDRAHQLENAGDEINHRIFEGTAVEFITPIEREDIIALANHLDCVLDYIEDVMLSLYMFDVQVIREDALKFAHIVKDACAAMHELMSELEGFKKKPRELHALLVKVNDFEEEGDRLYMEAIRRLYTTERDNAVSVVVWTEIFSRMEKCCDAAEHAADTVSMVLLKNS